VTPLSYINTPADGQASLGVVGYPADIPLDAKGQYMYESQGLVSYHLEDSDLMLRYYLDTAGGVY
jgi:hypothetical protein